MDIHGSSRWERAFDGLSRTFSPVGTRCDRPPGLGVELTSFRVVTATLQSTEARVKDIRNEIFVTGYPSPKEGLRLAPIRPEEP